MLPGGKVELSIGVRAEYRGRDLGARLIEALKRELTAAGFERVSLSVEPDNAARRIYERAGFDTVGTNGGSLTMVCRLPRPSSCSRSRASVRSP
jgi:GNAT superfamily N-acetyltransferase